jgi:hypothetical protein
MLLITLVTGGDWAILVYSFGAMTLSLLVSNLYPLDATFAPRQVLDLFDLEKIPYPEIVFDWISFTFLLMSVVSIAVNLLPPFL